MMETKTRWYKYQNLPCNTRIYFKGDKENQEDYGNIVLELPKGYLIDMDKGSSIWVHPSLFETFGGLFQVIEEREAKVSWLAVN